MKLWLLVFIASLVAIHLYFRTREGKPVTAMERGLATGWLWVRRVVCFFAAAICLLGAVALVVHGVLVGIDVLLVVGVVLLLALGGVCVHWGWVGMGQRRYDVSDDRPVHEERKRRYGW